MELLRSTIEKILEEQGIYGTLDIRPGRLENFRKSLLVFWGVLNLSSLFNPKLFLGISLSISVAFLVEQVVFWVNNPNDVPNFLVPASYRKSFERPLEDRITSLLVLIYIILKSIVAISFVRLGDGLFAILYGIEISFLFSILLFNIDKPFKYLEFVTILYKLFFNRFLMTVKIAFRTNVRYLIPSIVFLSILGAVSVDFWYFVDSITWVQLLLAIILFLLPIYKISQKRIQTKIKRIIRKQLDDESSISNKQLKKGVRLLSGDYFQLAVNELDYYNEIIRWKWRENILDVVGSVLNTDLKRQVDNVFRWTILGLVPLFFLVILISGVVFFSVEFLQGLYPNSMTILAFSPANTFWIWASNIYKNLYLIPNDILFKYSIVATLFVVGQFIISYPEYEQVFDELNINEGKIKNLISIMFAYEIINTPNFQVLNIPLKYADMNNPLFWVKIILIPDNVDEYEVIEFADEIVSEYFSVYTDGSRTSFVLMNRSLFLQTELYKSLISFYRFQNIIPEIGIEKYQENKVWAYIGEYYGGKKVYEFGSFSDAVSWVASEVTPLKYRVDS